MEKRRKQTGPPPAVPGVYVLALGSSYYVGASLRAEARIIDHIRDLSWKQHENVLLQQAYAGCRGRMRWTVKLMPGARPLDLSQAERRLIEHHLERGHAVLNREEPTSIGHAKRSA